MTELQTKCVEKKQNNTAGTNDADELFLVFENEKRKGKELF